MDLRRIRKSLGIVGIAALVLVAGLLTGSYLGQYRTEASRTPKQAGLQHFLEANLYGIEIGKPFPNVPLWSVDGSEAFQLHDLAPQGGVVFYVSSVCESCIDAVEALHTAIGSTSGSAMRVVLVCSPNPERLLDALTKRGIDMTLYCDVEDLFSREFNVRTTRTFFILDENGVVNRMGTAEFDPEEYVAIISGK